MTKNVIFNFDRLEYGIVFVVFLKNHVLNSAVIDNGYDHIGFRGLKNIGQLF